MDLAAPVAQPALGGPLVRELIDRYITEVDPIKKVGPSQVINLRLLQRMPIGALVASALESKHFVDHAVLRKDGWDGRPGVKPQTAMQDFIFLGTVLQFAKMFWKLPGVSGNALTEARPMLWHFGLIAKSNRRKRRPSREEFRRLLEYFRERDKTSSIPHADVFEFSIWSCRRLAEIFRLRWSDINFEDRTCVIRNMKDPRNKKGNDFTFPLLGRAWTLVLKQKARRKANDDRIFPHNHRTFCQYYVQAKRDLKIVDLHFHDNRREGVCRMLEAGYSIAEVQMVTGHKDLNSLQIYIALNAVDLHKGPASKRAAAERDRERQRRPRRERGYIKSKSTTKSPAGRRRIKELLRRGTTKGRRG